MLIIIAILNDNEGDDKNNDNENINNSGESNICNDENNGFDDMNTWDNVVVDNCHDINKNNKRYNV